MCHQMKDSDDRINKDEYIESIEDSVQILRRYDVPFALLHCSSTSPTPYSELCLEAARELHDRFQTRWLD
jgi:sialic acid synthase SpsE